MFTPEVVDAMTRQVTDKDVKPFKNNLVEPNAIVFAADYDIGRSGTAYHDKDSADYWVDTQKRTPWNSGYQYRNDGVDIQSCKDEVSNGYSVGWIEPENGCNIPSLWITIAFMMSIYDRLRRRRQVKCS